MPLSIGTRLGPYELRAVVGAGGMGEVYRAYDGRLSREVALKVLPKSVAGSPEHRERFEREARAVAQLDHPNIVTIHSIEDIDGVCFLTMQFVEGSPLQNLIPKSGMALDRFLKLAVPIADAIAAAHDRGIIHRDLKPSNIIVGGDDRVRVLDFGLATLRSDATPGDLTITAAVTGGHGQVVGTPAYMSPEQAEGRAVDHRSDCFSLGVMFYQMVTGIAPFSSDTALSTLASVVRDRPRDIGDLKPDSPRQLCRIIRRCLQKDRRHRYQNVADLHADLEDLARDADAGELEATVGPAAGADSRGWRVRLMGIGLALTAAIASGMLIQRWIASTSAVDTPSWRQLTANPADIPIYGAAISPDGRYAAYTDRNGVFLRLIETGETTRISIAGPQTFWELSWFPDGTRLLLTGPSESGQEMSVYSLPVLGGVPRKLQDDVWRAAVSPDGRTIAFLRATYPVHDIWLMDTTGERPRRVIAGGALQMFWQVGWSPDSSRIVYGTSVSSGPSIRTADLAGQDERTVVDDLRLFQAYRAVLPFVWLADDRFVYTLRDFSRYENSANLWEVRVDDAGNALGAPRQVTATTGTTIRALGATRDGRRFSALREHYQPDINIAAWNANTRVLGAPRRLTLDDRWDNSRGQWTHDGKAVLFESNRSGNWDIFRQPMDSPWADTIVMDAGDDEEPVITPDQRWLLYWREQELVRRPVAGGPSAPVLRAQVEGIFQRLRCGYASGSRCILLEAEPTRFVATEIDPLRGRGRQLAAIPREGPGFHHWDLSHDGRQIALVDFGSRIRFVDLADGSLTDVTVPDWTAIEYVGWAADGRGVFVNSFSRRGPRLANTALLYVTREGTPTVIRHEENEWHIFPSASPSGTHLAFSTMRMASDMWLLERPE